MAKKKNQIQEPEQKQTKQAGLECLDDATLARIVENDVEQNDCIKSQEADIAFKELARRSGHDF